MTDFTRRTFMASSAGGLVTSGAVLSGSAKAAGEDGFVARLLVDGQSTPMGVHPGKRASVAPRGSGVMRPRRTE